MFVGPTKSWTKNWQPWPEGAQTTCYAWSNLTYGLVKLQYTQILKCTGILHVYNTHFYDMVCYYFFRYTIISFSPEYSIDHHFFNKKYLLGGYLFLTIISKPLVSCCDLTILSSCCKFYTRLHAWYIN